MPHRTQRKQRVPKLSYTENRGIGWHVSYRDPKSGTPRKHRFGMMTRAQAEKEYHQWVAHFLEGILPEKTPRRTRKEMEERQADSKKASVVPGSLLSVTSSLLDYEQSRARKEGEPRRPGSISFALYKERKKWGHDFLAFLNSRYGDGAVASMQLADMTMEDVEAYNRSLVEAGHSASLVSKRMQLVRGIVERAGRPEHGGQVLAWNWDSRDALHGRATVKRKLPTLPQLKSILHKCSARETAMVWLAIGCGFGQRDLAAIRVGQLNRKSYDLRRGKTGLERYGDTPLLVWNVVRAYLRTTERSEGDLLFVTKRGRSPIVHGTTSLGGFYVLRHLGATEYGSRSGTSIGDIKRWLGHSASSQVADVYMKPVSPENRPVVEWVRRSLDSGKADIRRKSKP